MIHDGLYEINPESRKAVQILDEPPPNRDTPVGEKPPPLVNINDYFKDDIDDEPLIELRDIDEIKEELRLRCENDNYMAITITIDNKKWWDTEDIDIRQVCDHILRDYCREFTLLPALQSNYNIHWHGVCKIRRCKMKRFKRVLREIMGFHLEKEIDNSEKWFKYCTNNIEQRWNKFDNIKDVVRLALTSIGRYNNGDTIVM